MNLLILVELVWQVPYNVSLYLIMMIVPSLQWLITLQFKCSMILTRRSLPEQFAEIREEDMLSSLEKVHGLDFTVIDAFSLPGLPLPPKTFRGIRKKQSSLKRWLNICADESMK